MNKSLFFAAMLVVSFILCLFAFALDDISMHPSCNYCGMDRKEYARSRMFIEYDDKTTVGTCSVHCTASEIASHREKTLIAMQVGDYGTEKLIDAKKAFWVIGGNKTGVMTKRAKWAFGQAEDAKAFVQENGGTLATYQEAMKATFEDMYGDISMIRERRKSAQMKLTDTTHYPECKYCGMNRREYAHSRMLVEYDDGTAAGTCSIHCASIDLALSLDKTPMVLLVGDYRTHRLIDAERAFWVIGGDKTGVMTIRGKWAFEDKADAERFVKEHGGRPGTFEETMKATFEDMYEILR